MKDEFAKWMPVIALACFAAAVFLIAEGYFWPGIALIGARRAFLPQQLLKGRKTMPLTR